MIVESFAGEMLMGNQRQKVLVLYLSNSALDSNVLAWSIYDGQAKRRIRPAIATYRPTRPGLTP